MCVMLKKSFITTISLLNNTLSIIICFVNKLDLDGADFDGVLSELKEELSENIVNFCDTDKNNLEESIALCDEDIMHAYLETDSIDTALLKSAIAKRKLFPVFSGSALKMEGVKEFLEALDDLTEEKKYPEIFGARVFKIATDEKNRRLTFVKITGGCLKVKDVIDGEKVNEIRIYSGEKYTTLQSAEAGTVVAGILSSLPVCGFLPILAALFLDSNVPKPTKVTFLPLETVVSTVSTNADKTSAASF